MLAHAAPSGAQTDATDHLPASDSVLPATRKTQSSHPKVAGELTVAPLEDDLLHGDEDGKTDEADGENDDTR